MKIKLLVEGMTCEHCLRRVEKVLQEVPGVVAARADLDSKSVTVELDPDREVDWQMLRAVIEDAGYDVTGQEAL